MRRTLAAILAASTVLAVGALPAALAQGAPAQAPAPAAFGEPFAAGTFANLNPGQGEARIDLGAVLGKKPVVLVYFIPGHARAEAALRETVDLVRESKGDVAVYAVAAVAAGQDTAPVTERVEELGVRVPVLMDENFGLGQRLRVQVVPSITMIDREGVLRLANAGSLKQDLEYKMTVRDALTRLARTGKIGTYGSLPRYEPATELVGQEAPDFTAPATDGIVRKWSSMVDPRKVNVLVYWSVNCAHCRKTLPEINRWVKANGNDVNVVTAAKVDNEAMRVQTREFADMHGFVFPTLLDVDSAIFDAYAITATPTMFVVGPDGTVDSLLSAGEDFGAQVEAKKRELLGSTAGG